MKGPARLREALEAHGKVALDAGVYRAYLCAEPGTGPLTLALFEWVERGRVQAVTSVLTMLSLLRELHHRRDEASVAEVAMLLPSFPNMELLPVTLPITERAVRYQVEQGLTEATALQLATARAAGAGALITTDTALRGLATDLDILVLDTFAA